MRKLRPGVQRAYNRKVMMSKINEQIKVMLPKFLDSFFKDSPVQKRLREIRKNKDENSHEER